MGLVCSLQVLWGPASCGISVSILTFFVFADRLTYMNLTGISMEWQAGAAGDGCKSTTSSFNLVSPRMNIRMTRFIIDGIITLPIALYGFIVFPDVPTTTRAFYLTEEVRNYT